MNTPTPSNGELTEKEKDVMENGFDLHDLVIFMPASPFQVHGYPCKCLVVLAKTGIGLWPKKRTVTLLTEYGKIIPNIAWSEQLEHITFLGKWEPPQPWTGKDYSTAFKAAGQHYYDHMMRFMEEFISEPGTRLKDKFPIR